jgi:hypothetical protein
MRQRTKAGTSKERGGARKGGRQRRIRFARRAEEFAAAVGVLLTREKVGQKRPLKTERGGQSKTRSAGADTRRQKGTKVTKRDGRKIGLGRKRVPAS